jgi:hypothetical protein
MSDNELFNELIRAITKDNATFVANMLPELNKNDQEQYNKDLRALITIAFNKESTEILEIILKGIELKPIIKPILLQAVQLNNSKMIDSIISAAKDQKIDIQPYLPEALAKAALSNNLQSAITLINNDAKPDDALEIIIAKHTDEREEVLKKAFKYLLELGADKNKITDELHKRLVGNTNNKPNPDQPQVKANNRFEAHDRLLAAMEAGNEAAFMVELNDMNNLHSLQFCFAIAMDFPDPTYRNLIDSKIKIVTNFATTIADNAARDDISFLAPFLKDTDTLNNALELLLNSPIRTSDEIKVGVKILLENGADANLINEHHMQKMLGEHSTRIDPDIIYIEQKRKEAKAQGYGR